MNEEVEKKYQRLMQVVSNLGYIKNTNLITKAFEFAKLAHFGEKRLSGEEFILHPLETAINVTKWKVDEDTIAAALLHDTVEHGAATQKDIMDTFGEEVYQLVDGVTKVSKLKVRGSREEIFVENLRKMFLAMSKDLRVVLLRFAERLDNLRTIDHLPIEKRLRFAKESLEIFSPLAERLGMWEVKTIIEETAFKHAFPDEYDRVYKLTLVYFKNAKRDVDLITNEIMNGLKKSSVYANIYGRKKSLYSVYRKLQRPEINWDIKKIHDFVALRVLTETVEDCYVSLGVVHNLYRPAPQLPLSDFIANPKPNGYRSLHTKVIGPDGRIVEVQIRTYEMHEEAEYGASSHIIYSGAKEGGASDEVLEKGKVSAKGGKLEWVRQLAEWQREIKDSGEFLKAVKFDALSARIFAFTPQGDVYDLPVGATPVDFAYAVHTGLGKYIKSAKVDGKSVPLKYKIINGQVVEIEKNKSPKMPSRDWLQFVVTATARSEIKKQLRKVNLKG